MLLGILVLVLCVYTNAGICIMNPEQRGGTVGAYELGAALCQNTTNPCGAQTDIGAVEAFWELGDQVDVTLQINPAEFNADNPGNITLYLWRTMAGPDTGSVVWKHLDTPSDDPSRQIVLSLDIPADIAPDLYTLQSVYFTNKGDPYYACADVVVTPPSLKSSANGNGAPGYAETSKSDAGHGQDGSSAMLTVPISSGLSDPMIWMAGLFVMCVITAGARSMTTRVSTTKYQVIRDLSAQDATQLATIPEGIEAGDVLADDQIDDYHEPAFY